MATRRRIACLALALAVAATPAFAGRTATASVGVNPARTLPATTARDLQAISTPAPKYPPEGLPSRMSGEVVVEFTVVTDGSVGAVRVVGTNLPRVFSKEAVVAVKRWRFQPIATPVTTRRTIGFKP